MHAISIHPPRTGWDYSVEFDWDTSMVISIHPPRTGWDHRFLCNVNRRNHFNPPTPHGVGRREAAERLGMKLFQSTHPARGGTIVFGCQGRKTNISIHPPRTGWDDSAKFAEAKAEVFQSTHPARGGTFSAWPATARFYISIHPPRTGWDLRSVQSGITVDTDFNPPTPHGVGRRRADLRRGRRYFNPPTPHGVGLC